LAVRPSRGRCYDHNFLRFLPIFCEKIGVFLKNRCYDQNFAYFSFVLSQKRQFFRLIFRRKYFKNLNIGPWSQISEYGPCISLKAKKFWSNHRTSNQDKQTISRYNNNLHTYICNVHCRFIQSWKRSYRIHRSSKSSRL
jgi:hypothetical protein